MNTYKDPYVSARLEHMPFGKIRCILIDSIENIYKVFLELIILLMSTRFLTNIPDDL